MWFDMFVHEVSAERPRVLELPQSSTFRQHWISKADKATCRSLLWRFDANRSDDVRKSIVFCIWSNWLLPFGRGSSWRHLDSIGGALWCHTGPRGCTLFCITDGNDGIYCSNLTLIFFLNRCARHCQDSVDKKYSRGQSKSKSTEMAPYFTGPLCTSWNLRLHHHKKYRAPNM